MKQRTFLPVAIRDKELLQRIQALKQERYWGRFRASWDYRSVWAYLRFSEGWAVGKKRVFASCANTTSWPFSTDLA